MGEPSAAPGASRAGPDFRLLLLIFAISGAGTLVVETTWMRWLRDWLGATTSAAAATTTAFFVGSAFGAWLGARAAAALRDASAALRGYAIVETLAAAGAAATPVLLAGASAALAAVYPSVEDAASALVALRFVAALVVTLPAAIAYGAALPLIGAAALPSARAIGTRGAALYAANVVGAILGVIVAAWWLPPRIGVRATYALGIALAIVAALLAWRARHGWKDTGAMQAAGERPRTRVRARPLVVAAIVGFVGLAAQVLLVQCFAQITDQSVTAFAAVLVVVLLALAIGAVAVSALRVRGVSSGRDLAGVALCASAIGFGLLPAWLARVTGLEYVGAIGPLPVHVAVVGVALVTAGPALATAALVWPATLAWAGEAAAAGAGGPDAGARIGLLSAANTVGAIGGGLAAPFLLLPVAGPFGGFLALAFLCAATGLLAVPAPSARRRRRAAALLVAGALVLGLASPLALPLTPTPAGESLVFERSTPSGVVAVTERADGRLIRLDGHYALGGTGERRHEERQGHVPLLLHGRPQRVAFVGTATGITASAALAHGVEHIHLVEIVPEVARVADRFFADDNRGVYRDPRSRVVLDDARNFFRHGTEPFDVIVADLFVPWRSGTGGLYSDEHFRAMRARLTPGGLVAQWLPLYQLSTDELEIVVATFRDVFPTVALFRGDFYGAYPIVALVGWRGRVASGAEIEDAVRRLAAAGVRDRWVADPIAFWAGLVAFAEGPADDAIPRNSLDRPRIEFLAAARHAGGRAGKRDALVGLSWLLWTEALTRRDGAAAPPFGALSPAAERARRGGALLQRASSLYVAGRAADASRALEEAAALLPASVLADASADASAADVWLDAPR